MTRKADITDYDKVIKKFEDAFSITHPIFESIQFHFNKSDQTLEHYGMQQWSDREEIAAEALDRMQQSITESNIRPAAKEMTYDRPFRIDELLEDEFDLINAGM
jgi:hypothetical protein